MSSKHLSLLLDQDIIKESLNNKEKSIEEDSTVSSLSTSSSFHSSENDADLRNK